MPEATSISPSCGPVPQPLRPQILKANQRRKPVIDGAVGRVRGSYLIS